MNEHQCQRQDLAGMWTGWNDIVKLHLSHQQIFNGLLLATGLVAAWLLRQQLSVFLQWVGDRQAVTDSIQQFGTWGPALLLASDPAGVPGGDPRARPHPR